MSLFEKIQNKRYDLQENKKKKSKVNVNPLIKAINKQSESDAAKDFKKDVGTDITKEVKKDLNRKIDNNNRFFTDKSDSETLKTKSTGAADEKVFKRTPEAQKAADTASKEARSVSSKIDPSEKKFVRSKRIVKNTNTVGVNQADVSKKAKEYTKTINQKNPNLIKSKPFFDDKKAKVKRAELIAGRKAYIDPKTNKASEQGIKNYITKARTMASGSNANNVKNKKAAEIISKSAGKEYAAKINDKYGGRLARKRPSNAKSFAQIKANIDAKNPTYPSPIKTVGKDGVARNRPLPLSTRKYSSPVDKFIKNIEKGKKVDPVGTTKALQNMPDDPRMPKKVLKVTEPGSKFKKSKFKGFDEVPTSDPVGRKIYKKWDTSGFETPKPPVTPVKKPNLFQRIKNISKKVLDPEGWKVPKKDWDLKPTRWDKAGNVLAQQRRTFPKTIRGSIRKNLAKLPNRYKALAVAAVGTSYAVDHVLNRKKKQQEADKKNNILPSGNDRTKIYTSPTVSLKLDNRKPGK